MDAFFIQQVLFLSVICVTLFLPGWFLLRAHASTYLTRLELLILALPLSFAITTLTTLVMAKAGVPLTPQTLLAIVLGITIFAGMNYFIAKRRTPTSLQPCALSHKQRSIFLLLFILMLVIKTSFLLNTIFPTATDLGHHMFWVQKIITTHTLPPYEKISLIPNDYENATTSSASFTPPKHIADFIVGEHIIFAIIGMLSHQHVVSAFPSLVLYLFNIFTILLVFIFALRLFAKTSYGTTAALIALMLIGPLYAVSGAQAKFVSGGVIGNVIGNLLILTILYALYRAITETSRFFMFLALFTTSTLLYTHHLSTLILGYTFFGIIITALLFMPGTIKDLLSRLRKTLLAPTSITVIIATILFAVFVSMPSYLNTEAITSSVGAPTKATRTGIPLPQLMLMSGEARFAFGILGAGLLFCTLFPWRLLQKYCRRCTTWQSPIHPYTRILLFGWFMTILLMTTMPALLHVNIISSRIATYIAFPLTFLAAIFLGWFLTTIPKRLPAMMTYGISFLIILFIWVNGLQDNNSSFTSAPKTQQAIQTFHASRYLRQTVPPQTWILKDHNYITADTWMKVFINSDYSNPLSRSYFKRYDTRPHREHCTREIITHPSSAMATACLHDLSIGPVVVNTAQDAKSLQKNDTFAKVYQNNDTSIFWHTPL